MFQSLKRSLAQNASRHAGNLLNAAATGGLGGLKDAAGAALAQHAGMGGSALSGLAANGDAASALSGLARHASAALGSGGASDVLSGLARHVDTAATGARLAGIASAAASGDAAGVMRGVAQHASRLGGPLGGLAGAAASGDAAGVLRGLAAEASRAAAEPPGPGRYADLLGAARRIRGPLESIVGGGAKALSTEVERAASGRARSGQQQSTLARIGRQLASRAPQYAAAAGRGELRNKAVGQLSGIGLSTLAGMGR
jgi:hypothetical protein